MKTQIVLSAAVLALAACGSPGSGGNGSAGASGGGGISLQPGEWEMKTEVVSVTAEGLPPGVAESMKKSAGTTSRSCMTPEEAKGPSADMFTRSQAGSNCKAEGFSWADGKIKGKTTCTGTEGAAPAKMVMTMDGRYDAQSMDMTMKTETDVVGKAMTMEMRVSGRRVGECSAATKQG